MRTHFKNTDYTELKRLHGIFLVSLILIGSFVFFLPVLADETSTSTPDIEENLSTEISTEIIEEETTSTIRTPDSDSQTPDTDTQTPTSTTETVVITTTPETEIPTSTIYLATTTVHLQIETYNATLYNQDVIVTECAINESSTSTALTPYCALQQLEDLDIEFANYGGEARFLSKIDNYDGTDWNWWAFFHNFDFASEAINEYILNEGDEILFTYGTWPLKMEISSTTPKINSTTTIYIKEFGFDDSWQATWLESASSTLIINNEEFILADGIYELEITTTTPYEIYGKKTGFIDSDIITIIATDTITTTSTTSTDDGTTDTGGTGGTGGSSDEDDTPELVSQTTINETVTKILNYFKSQQDETGKIIDGTITDWAIMSFGSDEQYADSIKTTEGKSLLEYEKEYNLDDPSDMNSCATYPRHVLALLSAGVKNSDPAILGLQEKMNTICYVENSYGLNGINDDVFALLALLALDTNTNEPIITDIITEIESWQLDSGAFSWPDWFDPTQKTAGDDITGAVINALKYAETKGSTIEQNIYSNATDYLKTTQQADGGWGYGSSDVMTTSWVLMGLNALNETQSKWFTDSYKNPWHPLTEQLTDEGFYESAWVPGAVDWFAMKHAVPALLGASWPIILDPIVEDFSEGATYTYGGGSNTSVNLEPVVEEITTPTSTPTSTLDILEVTVPTSTLDLNLNLNDDLYTKITTTTRVTTDYENYGLTSEYTDTITDEEDNKQNVTQTFRFDNEVVLDLPTTTFSDENSINSTEVNHKSEIINLKSDHTLSAPTTSTIPYSKTAKGVFAGATSMAGALGLYLAWRFLQTLV